MSSTAHSTTITTAAQFATVSRSAERVARARAYVDRLDTHAAEIRTRLDTLATLICASRSLNWWVTKTTLWINS